MPAPLHSTVSYTDQYNRFPKAGSPSQMFSTSGSRHSSPDTSFPRELLASPASPARRIAILLKKPCMQEPEEIDVKPYSRLQMRTVRYRDETSPAATSRDGTFIRSPQPITMDQFAATAERFRTSRPIPSVEPSSMMYKDETRQMIDWLKNPLTLANNPDLAGSNNASPVRRYYTINSMFSQVF